MTKLSILQTIQNKRIWIMFLPLSQKQYLRHPTHSSWSCHIKWMVDVTFESHWISMKRTIWQHSSWCPNCKQPIRLLILFIEYRRLIWFVSLCAFQCNVRQCNNTFFLNSFVKYHCSSLKCWIESCRESVMLKGILWDFFIFTLEQISVLNKYCI